MSRRPAPEKVPKATREDNVVEVEKKRQQIAEKAQKMYRDDSVVDLEKRRQQIVDKAQNLSRDSDNDPEKKRSFPDTSPKLYRDDNADKSHRNRDDYVVEADKRSNVDKTQRYRDEGVGPGDMQKRASPDKTVRSSRDTPVYTEKRSSVDRYNVPLKDPDVDHDEKYVAPTGKVMYSHMELEVLMGECRDNINDIMRNYDFSTYLSNANFKNDLRTLRQNCTQSVFTREQDTYFWIGLAEYFIEVEGHRAFCDVIVDGLNLGWVSDKGNVDKNMSFIIKTTLSILNNFTDFSPKVAIAVCRVTKFLDAVLNKLKEVFKKTEKANTYVDLTENNFIADGLLLFYNCSEVSANRSRLRQLRVAELLRSISRSEKQGDENRVMAILTLANILTEEDYKKMEVDVAGLRYLVQQLECAVADPSLRSHGWSSKELATGVMHLARNDANKQILVQQGVLPVLTRMSYLTSTDEQTAAMQALCALSFDENNQETIIKERRLLDRLLQLRTSSCKEVKRTVSRTIWNLRDKLKTSKEYTQIATSLVEKTDTPQTGNNHVMISYNWDNQRTLLRVREHLSSRGYTTWMDVHNMEGSTLQAMAEAVENSAAVLVCMSERYKDSEFCRLEFEYAFKCKKPIIPLLMQSDYTPDGWLGLVVNNLLYHDFSDIGTFDIRIEGVMRSLGDKGKACVDTLVKDFDNITPSRETRTHSTPSIQPQASADIKPSHGEVAEWTSQHVVEWLDNQDLPKQQSLSELTGKQLDFLWNLKKGAPETYYGCLKSDFGLTSFKTMMKFTEALDSLFL